MFGNNGFKIEPITFKETDIEIANIRLEYHIDGSRVQFHLWANPEFPENTEQLLTKALTSYPKDNVVIDFVPEVDSWYVEVNELSVTPTDALVASIIKKIARSMNNNG